MESQRDNRPRSGSSDAEDDAWTPEDPDPRDSFDETLPADRAGWEKAPERERASDSSAGA